MSAAPHPTAQPHHQEGQVVFTHNARCRDCYRCLRACPVKAIRLRDGQAEVVAERCIACGTCVRECPQGAKAYRDDTSRAEALLAAGGPVAVSLAPAFAGLFDDWERRRLPSALRRLGFARVEETSVGAHAVAEGAQRALEQSGPDSPVVCTACPAAVRWVERYRPAATPWLADVVSPMVAHARSLRMAEGGAPAARAVVFIGPCIAKKDEADAAPEVDVALTFEELRAWLRRAGIELAELEESGFDRAPTGEAAFFPAPGGLARSAGITPDLLADDLIVAEGAEPLADALDALRSAPRGVLVETLFCQHGCLNGPAAGSDRPQMARRAALLDYARGRRGGEVDLDRRLVRDDAPEPTTADGAVALPRDDFNEEDIRRTLAETGKGRAEDRLDCGACGYPTCRDKAVAVLRGMAEPEMCIPRMRRLAEQRTDRIIESSPNGILILDERLRILHTNPAFRRLFRCSEAILGRPVSYLMDAEPFERLVDEPETVLEFTENHTRYGVVCKQILYALEGDGQFVGIFVDMTDTRERRVALEALRSRTVIRARELMDHQIELAQNVARLLGESTARSEELVGDLIELVGNEAPASAGTIGKSGFPRLTAPRPVGDRRPPWEGGRKR